MESPTRLAAMAGAPRRALSALLLLAAAEALRRNPEAPADAPPAAFLEDLGMFDSLAEEDLAVLDSIDADDSWDLAVSQVVGELHPLDAVPPPVPILANETIRSNAGIDGQTALERKPRRWFPPLMHWVYGAQHKTGTNLLRSLAIEQGHVTGLDMCLSVGAFGYRPQGCDTRKKPASIWFECNMDTQLTNRLKKLGAIYRGVHIVRDPVAMVISGYIYHMNASNRDTPKDLVKIRSMPLQAGLKHEAEWVLAKSAQDMVNEIYFGPKHVMTVRFESFTQSSASFDATVKALYDHMINDLLSPEDQKELLERAKAHDLRRSKQDNHNGHVASQKHRTQVKWLLDHLPPGVLWRLKNLRMPLGYAMPAYGIPGVVKPAFP